MALAWVPHMAQGMALDMARAGALDMAPVLALGWELVP
jgi:hypothetical protein